MVHCIHSHKMPRAAAQRLLELGFRPALLPPSEAIGDAVADHVDLSLLLLRGRGFVTREGYDRVHPLCPSLPLTVIEEPTAKGYPEEARLNLLTVGEDAFFLSGNAPRAVLAYLTDNGYRLHPVKQGYPACTVLAPDARHAISSDEGMRRALFACGIEVLAIGTEGVSLPPYPYGFLGGAAGVYGGTVYFLGDLRTHPDGERIAAFIEGCGMRIESLCDGGLVDLGGLAFVECDDEEHGK